MAQDAEGHIYMGRNMDLGSVTGGDIATHTWKLTPALADLMVNVRFIKGGKELYNATHFASYVGLLTGSRRGGFSVAVNTRFDTAVDRFLFEWLAGGLPGAQFAAFQLRTVMESGVGYSDAVRALSSYKPIGPGYTIIGGAKSGEGAVISLGGGKDNALSIRALPGALANGSYYVLQTNYDHPGAPPAWDDRRYPAENCLDSLGASKMNYKSLWGIMDTNPTRNAWTVQTTLMSAETGHYECFKQGCIPGPHCTAH